jgi:hypothetical protein
MKELKLMDKEIKLEGRPANLSPVKASSIDMLRACLEGVETNRKGILRISRVLKVLDKIQKAEDEKFEKILFEDSDFEIVYESADKFEWGTLAMRFPEFFTEIEEAEHRKVEVTKKVDGGLSSVK